MAFDQNTFDQKLLITTDEFIQNFESKTQTDVVFLDFSKVFDVVSQPTPLAQT